MNRCTRPFIVTIRVLSVIVTARGGLAFLVGSALSSTVVVDVHGVSGPGLILLVPARIPVPRRGVRRPGRSRKVISPAFWVIVVPTVGSSLPRSIGGSRPHLGLSPMQIHVGTALVAVVPGSAAPPAAHRHPGVRVR